MGKPLPKELRDQIRRSGISEAVIEAKGKDLESNLMKLGKMDRRSAEAAAREIWKKSNPKARDEMLKDLSEEKDGWSWDNRKRDKIEHVKITGQRAKEELFQALKKARSLDMKKSILTKFFRIEKTKREKLLRIFKTERVVSKDRQALDTSSPVYNKLRHDERSVTASSDFITSHQLSAVNNDAGGHYSNVSAGYMSAVGSGKLESVKGGSASINSPKGGIDPGFLGTKTTIPLKN